MKEDADQAEWREFEDLVVPSSWVRLSRPTESGFMPFSAAAYWILSKGGTVAHDDLRDPCVWGPAFEPLCAHISVGNIEVVGRPRGGDVATIIDRLAFVDLAVLPPFGEPSPQTLLQMLLGEAAYLQTYLHLGEEEPISSDRLYRGRSGPAYTHIVVARASVLKFWPLFDTDANELCHTVLPQRRPGPDGNKPRYDWDSFLQRAHRLMEENGSFNPKAKDGWHLGALEKDMTDWCDTNWDIIPAESTVRRWCKVVVKNYESTLRSNGS